MITNKNAAISVNKKTSVFATKNIFCIKSPPKYIYPKHSSLIKKIKADHYDQPLLFINLLIFLRS